MNVTDVLYLIVIALLVLLCGLYAASDTALSSVNMLRLEKEAQEGDKKSERALEQAKNYDRSIATILFGNDFLSIFVSSLASIVGASILANSPLESYGDLIITAITILVVLLFGEILPKAIATSHALWWSKTFGLFIEVSRIIFFPFVAPMDFLARKIASPIIEKAPTETPLASDEELEAMVEEIKKEGIFDKNQSELLHRSIDFKDTSSYDIMTPRIKIIGYDVEEPFSSYLKRPDAYKHSRVIVYRKDLDHVLGFFQVKTLLRMLVKGKTPDVSDIILPTLFVPRTMELSSVLALMKKTKTHIAVVKDEFGGTEGLLTLEDILEELVGEMWDEEDTVSLDISRVNGTRNKYYVRGSMNIEKFFETFHMDPDNLEDDYSTLSGYINDKLGRFAEIDDKITIGKVDIIVKKVNDFRVENCLVIYHPRRKTDEEST